MIPDLFNVNVSVINLHCSVSSFERLNFFLHWNNRNLVRTYEAGYEPARKRSHNFANHFHNETAWEDKQREMFCLQ